MGLKDFIQGGKAYITAAKAYKAHGNGDYAAALELYKEAYDQGGLTQPQHLLGFTVLLIRTGEYEKAKGILVGMQKNPQMTQDQRTNLFVNYAACVYKMGELDKGINLLMRQHQHAPCGLLYQTLGYLLVEKYCPENEPDFDAIEAAERAAAEAAAAQAAEAEDQPAQEAPAEETPAGEEEAPEEAQPVKSAREKWQEGFEAAEKFEAEAVDYDEEDPICLDNMGQWVYRVKGDPAAAKTWFDQAIKLKENQIDTLWFLSRYDLEAGDTAAAVEKLKLALTGRFSPLNYADKSRIEAELARLQG